MTWVILTAMIPAIGTVTSPDSAGIPGATVTLATLEEIVMNTAQTNINGNYKFTDVASGYYHLTSKHGYWPDSDTVTVSAGENTNADIMLCMIYDFKNNSGPADAGRGLSNDGRRNSKRNYT